MQLSGLLLVAPRAAATYVALHGVAPTRDIANTVLAMSHDWQHTVHVLS
jgi:hypothetical protein